MITKINYHLFNQINIDSNLLTMSSSIIHRFVNDGIYRISIHEPNGVEKHTDFIVDSESPVLQANIDVSSTVDKVECKCKTDITKNNSIVINPKGYIVFYVSTGPGGYSITVNKLDLKNSSADDKRIKETRVFDTSKLKDGDMFAVTILKPGKYIIKNMLNKSVGNITVEYPEKTKSKKNNIPKEPVIVQVTENGFDPSNIKLRPTQGLLLKITSNSRIKIEMMEALDIKVKAENKPKISWHNPLPPKNEPLRKKNDKNIGN